MAVFVILAAIAMTAQAGFLFAIYKSSRRVSDTVVRMSPQMEALMASSKVTLDESRTKIAEITSKANFILDQTQTQLARVDSVMGDAQERAHRQLARAEMLVDDTLGRAHQAVAMVHGGVLKPLREINGVAAGLKAAIQYLNRANRPHPHNVTVDEEMFI